MRTLALAEYLAEGGAECRLLTTSPHAYAVMFWRNMGLPVTTFEALPASPADTAMTRSAAAGADWLVLDGYYFSDDYRRTLHGSANCLLQFDDTVSWMDNVNLFVNQNPGAERCETPTPNSLLGARYAVFRRAIRTLAPVPHTEPPSVLATFGGFDPASLVLAAVKALVKTVSDCNVDAVASGELETERAMRAWARGHGDRFHIHSVGELAPLMGRATVALCAGGTTSLELASLGVPMVIVICAENQRAGAVALAASGCAIIAGDGPDALSRAAVLVKDLLGNTARRQKMAAAGRRLIDGKGVMRIATAMHSCEAALVKMYR